MKCLLRTTTALVSVAATAGPAAAAEPIRLMVGGFFREAYMVNFDDDGEGELGNERNTDGFFNDAEIHFMGMTTLDNGLSVGARVELEGEDNAGDQIDEAWIYFSGGFGEVRIGSNDDALAGACILPPGGTDNFSAFSPNQWAANVSPFAPGFPALTSNAVCIGVDDREDAQKIVYMTPVFGGFQLRLSYTPNGGDERHGDGVGAHIGMPTNADSRIAPQRLGLWDLRADARDLGPDRRARRLVRRPCRAAARPRPARADLLSGRLNLTFGAFSVGGVFEYYDNLLSFKGGDDADAWVVGGGLAYDFDDFVLGAQYSHQSSPRSIAPAAATTTSPWTAPCVTAIYPLGPGIDLDAEIAYTWIDTDPESADGVDDYQSLEIGLGTAITF